MELRMKESHRKGLAIHPDPESCDVRRKADVEALTGAYAGWVLSSEIRLVRGADVVILSGRPYRGVRHGKCPPGPAGSETPSMHGSTTRENWELPRPPAWDGHEGRTGKPGGVSR